MAKETTVTQEQVNELLQKIALLEAQLKDKGDTKKPASPAVDKSKFVTIQHIGKIRQWTVLAVNVLKEHNKRVGKIDHPRFKKNAVLLPGCIVDVVPELAKVLIKSRDFQKYGVEAV